MMAESSSSRVWVLAAAGVVAPVLAVVVGWWVAAESTREEALRAERRVAYTRMVEVANECGSEASFSVTAPIVRGTLRDLGQEPGFEEFADQMDKAAADILPSPQQAMDQIQGCYTNVTTAATRVRLVTDDMSVWRSVDELQSATLAVPYYDSTPIDDAASESGPATGRFLDALGEFEAVAQDDVHEPAPFFPRSTKRVVGPLILTAGFYLLLATVVSIGLVIVRLMSRLASAPSESSAAVAQSTEPSTERNAE